MSANHYAPDGSFGLATADFDVVYQQSRSRKSDSLISIRPLPFGGGAVVQSGGLGPRTWQFAAFMDSNNTARLEAARGYHGTLMVFEGTVGCTLISTDSGSDWYPDGRQTVTFSVILDN